MPPHTLNDVFFAIVARKQDQVMLTREAGFWRSISSQELYRGVVGVARAFVHWGVKKGDRIAILSENRAEWAIADFASLLLGAVVVPIYSTLTAAQTAYILADSGATVAVVSSEEQLRKVLSIKAQTAVEKVLVMDPVESADAVQMKPLMHKGPAGRDLDLETRAHMITASDLASIIYTSGTTGRAKGVQLTHGNLTSNILNSMHGFDVRPGDISISFLPLSHVTARHADFAFLLSRSYARLLPVLRPVAAGTAGGAAHDLRCRAPRLRKTLSAGGAESFQPREAHVISLGTFGGPGESVHHSRRRDPDFAQLGACQQVDIFESTGAVGWTRRNIRFGWSASWFGIGDLVRRHRNLHSRRIWTHRNVAGHCNQ